METTLSIGTRVRPSCDGEDTYGRKLAWTRMIGTVVDVWTAPGRSGEVTCQVKWDRRAPYPTSLPVGMLKAVQS